MSADDDEMIVVILENDEETPGEEMIVDTATGQLITTTVVKQEAQEPSNDSVEPVTDAEDDIFEVVQKYGIPLPELTSKIKEEKCDEFEYEYLEDGSQYSDYEPEELEELSEESSDDEFRPNVKFTKSQNIDKRKRAAVERHRSKLVPLSEAESLVQKLRVGDPFLANNREALITELATIMKNLKPPPPPEGYALYINERCFECATCQKITETEAAAERHYAEKHGSRYLTCFACGVDFRSITNLYKHEKRCMHPDSVIVLRARAIAVGVKGSNRPFLIANDRTSSIIANKLKPEPKKFDCAFCSATYSCKVSLVAHEYLHKGERPFQCEECPASFTAKAKLTRHMLKHSDEHYECDYCGRTFQSKERLTSHLDIHKLRFQCKTCQINYSSKKALTIHMDKIHLNKPPMNVCNLCTKSYYKMSELKVHMKKRHGLLLMTRNMLMKQLPKMSPQGFKEFCASESINAFLFKEQRTTAQAEEMDRVFLDKDDQRKFTETFIDPGDPNDVPLLDSPEDYSQEYSEHFTGDLNEDTDSCPEDTKEFILPQTQDSVTVQSIDLEYVLKGNKKFKVVTLESVLGK